MKRIDLTGQRFGRLLVLQPTQARRGRTTWLCQCDCGQEKIVVGHDLKNGDIQSCGCLKIEVDQEKAQLMIKARTQFSPQIAAARNAWRTHYSEITFDDFYILSQQNCFYCGAEPANKLQFYSCQTRSQNTMEEGIFIYNGLDRINSLLGHTIDNVITCCWICNRAKRNRTIEQFMVHISNLIHQKHNRFSIEQHKSNSLLIDVSILYNENNAYKTSINHKFLSGYNDGDLTLEQFYQLSQLNCYYCGQIPSNTIHSATKKSSKLYKANSTFIYSGLDRIDCQFPHNYDNVISACKYCNYAKQRLSLIEFNRWIDKLEKNKKDQE